MFFQFQNFEIECCEIESELLFLGSDVSEVLGFSNSSRSIKLHTQSHQQRINPTSNRERGRPAIYLTLSGVIKMVLKSNREDAVEFQDWICDEVIPSILEDGGYFEPSATRDQLDLLTLTVDELKTNAQN